MYDYIDDQGVAPLELLGIEVQQDTTDRDDTPAAYFAWPERKKFAMVTRSDVLTSSIYYGLFAHQLPEPVQEKVASNLNRSIDALHLRSAIEKVAVLPDYSRLSQKDLEALSKDDTPSDRLKRRLKRMGIYGGIGAVGGGGLGKLVTGRIHPLWAAIPAAMGAGVGLAKGASGELVGHLLREQDDLESALENAEQDLPTHAPPERRKYAKRLKVAAEQAGLPVPTLVEEYASDAYGPRMAVGLKMRTQVDERYEKMANSVGDYRPHEFAEQLYELDQETGVVANHRIPDAFYTTFGKRAAEKGRTVYLKIDGRPFTDADIANLEQYRDVLKKILPAAMLEQLLLQPFKFGLLDSSIQEAIARAILDKPKSPYGNDS